MIGIVTVNFNGFDMTLALVRQLLANEEQDFQLVVVNNSPDEAEPFTKYVEFEDHRVTVIHCERNAGYAGGLNAGIRALLTQPAIDQFLLLNNDVKLEKEFIRQMFERGSRTDRIYAPLILLKDTGLVQNSGGDLHIWLGGSINLNKNVPVSQVRRRQPGFLSGCILFMNRAVIEKVGLFDEKYGSYLEDVDYCHRAQAHGIQGEVLWDVHARHFHSYSTQGISSYKVFLLNRNQIYFARKHLAPVLRWIFITAAIVRGFVMNISGNRLGPYLRGVKEGFDVH